MTHTHKTNTVPIIWATLILGLAGFLAVAWLVGSGFTETWDKALLLSLRDAANPSDAWGPPWFEEAAAEVSALGGFTVLTIMCLLALGVLLLLRKRAAALFLLLATLLGGTASTLLKLVFQRPRPDLVDHLDRTFTASFPSGHAMISMLTLLTLAAVAVRFIPHHAVRVFVVSCAIVLALLIGCTRVYLGVHWPSDVLAGWFLGVSWASGAWLAAHYLRATMERKADLGHSRG